MKKAIAVIAALVLIGGAFFAGLSVGTYRPGYYLEESKVYSKEDIEKCARLARKRKAYTVRTDSQVASITALLPLSIIS